MKLTKLEALLTEAPASLDYDLKEVDTHIANARKAHVDQIVKALTAHRDVKNFKRNDRLANFVQSHKGVTFDFTYKGHPVRVELSHSGATLFANGPTNKHLSTKMAQTIPSFFNHLDRDIKAKEKKS